MIQMTPLPFSPGEPAQASHSTRVRTAMGMASHSGFFIVEFVRMPGLGKPFALAQ